MNHSYLPIFFRFFSLSLSPPISVLFRNLTKNSELSHTPFQKVLCVNYKCCPTHLPPFFFTVIYVLTITIILSM
ncbi:hypothetical protein BDC45DRAFT_523172 [Circinella umbellata]|nr:hypothetical protein BDC45DRAFT_523172 [Circinella umbellata]